MLVLCRLTIPFALSVPDGHAQAVNYLGEHVSVELRRVPGRRIHSYSDDERGTWLDEAEGRHFYRLVHDAPDGTKVVNRLIACRDDIEDFIEGVVDTVRYTAVTVAFEVAGTPLVENDERLDGIKQKALSIVRYFLNAYRTVAADPDVFIPADNDSPIIDVYSAEEYEFGADGLEGTFQRFSRQISWYAPEKTGLLKGVLNENDRDRLRTRLAAGRDVPVHLLTLIDARHQSHAFGQHRLAIVLAATAFELFVQTALSEECAARGITALPLGPNGEHLPADEAVQSGRIRDELLGDIGALLTGASLRTTARTRAGPPERIRSPGTLGRDRRPGP